MNDFSHDEQHFCPLLPSWGSTPESLSRTAVRRYAESSIFTFVTVSNNEKR